MTKTAKLFTSILIVGMLTSLLGGCANSTTNVIETTPTATVTLQPTEITNTPIPIEHIDTPIIEVTATPKPEATATNTPYPTATDTPAPTPTATNTPTPTPTATNTPTPTATATPAPDYLSYIFSVEADYTDEYWNYSEILGQFNIKLNKKISVGSAYATVYIPYFEEMNGEFTFEWWIHADTYSERGRDISVSNTEFGLEGVTLTLAVDFNFSSPTDSFLLELKSHHNGYVETPIAVYNLNVVDAKGEKISSGDFADCDFHVYDTWVNKRFGDWKEVEYEWTRLSSIKGRKYYDGSKYVATNPINTNQLSKGEVIALTIDKATDDQWWYSSEDNLFFKLNNTDFRSTGVVRVFIRIPEDSQLDGEYGFEASLNEVSLLSYVFETLQFEADQLSGGKIIAFELPYDEKILEYEEFSVTIKTHHNGMTDTKIEVFGLSIDDLNGYTKQYCSKDYKLTGTKYNYITDVRTKKEYSVSGTSEENKLSYSGKGLKIAGTPKNKLPINSLAFYINNQSAQKLSCGVCSVILYIPDDGKSGNDLKFGITVYGNDNTRNEQRILCNNDFTLNYRSASDCFSNNAQLLKTERGVYLFCKELYSVNDLSLDEVTVSVNSDNGEVEYFIYEVRFTDVTNGTIISDFNDTLTFVRNQDNSVSNNIQVSKIGRKLALDCFKSTMYVAEKQKVDAISEVYDDIKAVIKSSNTSVAEIGSDGTITGKKPGTVTITVTNTATKDVRQYTLSVVEPYISIVNRRAKLYLGKNYHFDVAAYGIDAGKYTWQSSDESVVSVDQNGNVITKKCGKAKIKVTDSKNKKSTEISVTVAESGNTEILKYVNIGNCEELPEEVVERIEKHIYEVAESVFDMFNYGEYIYFDVNYDYIDDPGVAAYAVRDSEGNCYIVIGIDTIQNNMNDMDVVTHEMIHVAQHYDFTTKSGEDVTWLGEGLTDYGRYVLGLHNEESGWRLPEYDSYQYYTDSYGVTASFIKYVVETYDSNFVTKLNDALKMGEYEHSLWKDCTGYTIDELWERYAKAAQ